MRDFSQRADRVLTVLVLLLPGALIVLLSLHSGGFFPDWSAAATLVLLVALLLRATLGSRAFAGLSSGLLLGGAALTAFTAWVLVSGSWSHAWSRALLEYSRDLGYLVALVLFGLLGRAPGRARILLLGLAAGATIVAALALLAWFRPDVIHVGGDFARERLSWPLSYWNTTGLLSALGALWCFGLTCADPSRVVRVVACAALPLFVAVVYFAVSRGAVLAGVVGLVVYLLAGPSRGLVTGGLGAGAAALGAWLVASGADGLNVATLDAAARHTGRTAETRMVLVILGVAALRALLLVADARLARVTLGATFARRAWAAVGAGAVVAVVVAVAAGGVHQVRHAYTQFTTDASVSSALTPQERFTQLGSNGRIDHWRVAIHEGFDHHPFHGQGAGTYAIQWAHGRTTNFTVVDGHSLYIEVLSELGIAGLALLVAALVALLAALARRTRRGEDLAWAALLAAAVAWAVRAGIDWDWEMPAVTLWVMAAGGLALGGVAVPERGAGILPVRVAVGLGCLLLALLPLSVLRSQTALQDGVQAFQRHDCPGAVSAALRSNDALGARPEPFELLAWCDIGLHRPELARAAVAASLRRDPDNWELHYDDALVLAATGGDPRAAIARAAELNPLRGAVRDALPVLGRPNRPAVWARYALRAPLPLAG